MSTQMCISAAIPYQELRPLAIGLLNGACEILFDEIDLLRENRKITTTNNLHHKQAYRWMMDDRDSGTLSSLWVARVLGYKHSRLRYLARLAHRLRTGIVRCVRSGTFPVVWRAGRDIRRGTQAAQVILWGYYRKWRRREIKRRSPFVPVGPIQFPLDRVMTTDLALEIAEPGDFDIRSWQYKSEQ